MMSDARPPDARSSTTQARRTGGTANRELRILHIITRLDRGGSSINTLMTAAGLPPPFRQCLVFGQTRELPQLALELRGKAEMIELPQLVRHLSPVRDCVALWHLYRHIHQGAFDLVHTHTSKAGVLGRVAARLAGVPRVVHTPHGHVFAGYAGKALTILFILLERWAAIFTDQIIGLTDREIQDHLERKIGKPEQYRSIPSGIEIERFRQRDQEKDAGQECIIGSVGRLEPVKGHVYLLEAFAILAPHFPRLRLVLVGDGPLRAELQDLAGRLRIAERVCFPGWREDVSTLLQTFDLFAFPSLNEGMGRALVEAMAAGLPIVACRSGGIPEVLAEGQAGLLVEAGHAPALARGIERLLRDPELCRRMGQAAQARAQRYSREGMLEQIETLYRELLLDSHAPSHRTRARSWSVWRNKQRRSY